MRGRGEGVICAHACLSNKRLNYKLLSLSQAPGKGQWPLSRWVAQLLLLLQLPFLCSCYCLLSPAVICGLLKQFVDMLQVMYARQHERQAMKDALEMALLTSVSHPFIIHVGPRSAPPRPAPPRPAPPRLCMRADPQ